MPQPRLAALLLAIAVTTAGTPARADLSVEAPDLELGLGGAIGGDKYLYLDGYLEGGAAVLGPDVWARLRVASGLAMDLDLEGGVVEATAGLEGRRCVRGGGLCAALGAAAGWMTGQLREHESEMTYDVSALVLALRSAVDVHVAGPVRLRVGVEMRRVVGDTGTAGDGGGGGFLGTLGLVTQF
jgi:hypothetical protein